MAKKAKAVGGVKKSQDEVAKLSPADYTPEELRAAKDAAEAEAAAKANADEAGKPSAKATSVDVVGANGVIRTYSKELHGAKFRAYADEFAGKAEGRHVVAHAEE